MNANGNQDITTMATSSGAVEQDVLLQPSWSGETTLVYDTNNGSKTIVVEAKTQVESSLPSEQSTFTTAFAQATDSSSSFPFTPSSITTTMMTPPSTTDSPRSPSLSPAPTLFLLPGQSPSSPATEALSVAGPSIPYPSPLSHSPSPSPSFPPSTATATTTASLLSSSSPPLVPSSSLTLPSFPSSSSSPSSPSSSPSSLPLPHSHSHSHSPASHFPSLTLPPLPSSSISSSPPSTHSSPPVPVSSVAASPDDITPTTAAPPAAKTAPEQQDESTTTHNNSSLPLVVPLETKETHLPAPVAHPHPRSRQPLSPEQEQEQEELHHPTRPLSPLSPVAAAAPRANIISNKGRYQEQQEQGQRQGQRRLLSPADIPGLSLSLAFGRQTAPFLFGLGPLSLSFLFPFQLVVVVSPPSTTTTDKDHPTSLLGHYCCPTDLFFVPFNSTCCCHHCSSTYTTCRSRGSLPFLLQRALLSHLQSWSLQSLFVAYSLPLLVCLTPGLVLPLSIFQILSLIASSSSSSPSSPISSDQPHFSSLPFEKTSSIATNNSNLIKNATSSTISKPSPPSFLFSFFSSSPPSSTPTSTHRRHFRSNYSLTHNQTTAPTTNTTTRQTPMSSSSSSSSSSNVTGGSSSSFRIDFPPPLPLPPPRQAPWSPTSSSSGSSSSASSSSSTSTITVATRTQAQASSHRPHFNQHAFAPPPPLTQTHTQTQQQQQLQFRQPLPRHSNNTESTIDYDSEQQYHEQHHNHNHEHEHDHEYDHGSDDESEGDAMSNELEYYLQRCSICFDSRLDFCLEMCRDQFCRDCFQKYVKEVVSNSWGLDVTKIKCPVCQDPLPLAEWSKYVDQATLAQYQQYNQPYRSFSRFCNGCDNEVAISRVKQSILGLPSRDLLPLFETLLVQLKSLLLLGGLNPEASSKTSSASTMFSSMDRHKRHKHSGTGLLKRDVRAQELVQQFIKDYRSFCGPPQGNGTTIPSMAHSYFSSLAMRALGGGSAPPVPAPPPANTGQHSNVRVIQPGVHGAPGGGQSVGFQQHLDARSAHPLQDSAYRSVPSSLFQRKQQQPVTATGVLEMYKDLMVTLIELFDLKFPEQHDSVEVAPQADAMDESEAYAHLGTPTAVTRMSASGKVATDTDLCGGVTIETVRIPKRTVTDRSKIVTRAETRRQLEVKKALVRFSKELLSLEVRPEQWKELQFLHVRWCRWDWCNTCDLELCLQCGVSSHHESKTCFEHMRSVITTNTPTSRRSRASKVESCSPLNLMGYKGKERSDLDTGTMQWKLANTNPCPNCCILIHRDDGCNKVDCMLCGHRFCWVCREAWDVGCGFFRCRLAAEEPAGEEPDDHWEKHPDEWKDNDVQAAEQVETLTIAMGGEPPHAGQGQTDTLTMRHDRRRRRSDDLSAAISEKPEIGVPNVFMIQAKRSRA